MHSVKGTESAQPAAVEESLLGQIQESARRLGISSERVVRALQTAVQRKFVIDIDALKVLAEVGAVRIIKSEELTRLGDSLAADSNRIAAAPDVQRKLTELQEELAFAEADVEAAVALTESFMTRFFGYRFQDRWDLLREADERHAEIEAELNSLTRELQKVDELKNGISSRTQELAEFVVSGEWSYAITPKGVQTADLYGAVPPAQQDLAQVGFNVRRFDEIVATAVEVRILEPRKEVVSLPTHLEDSDQGAPSANGAHWGNGMAGSDTDPAEEALSVVASQRDAQSVNHLIEVVAPRFSSPKLVELVRELWNGGMIPAGEMADVITTHAQKLGSTIAPVIAEIAEKLVEDESDVDRGAQFLVEHARSFRRFDVPAQALTAVAEALGSQHKLDRIEALLTSFTHLLSPDNLTKILDSVWHSGLSVENFYSLVAQREHALGVHFSRTIEEIVEFHLDKDSPEQAEAVVIAHPLSVTRGRQFPSLVVRLVQELADKQDLVPVSELVGALAPRLSRANLGQILNAALESSLSSDDCGVLISLFKDRLGPDFLPIACTLARNCIDQDNFVSALTIVKEHTSSLRNDPKFEKITTDLARHFGEECETDELTELVEAVRPHLSRKKTVDLLIAALDAGLGRSEARRLADAQREYFDVSLAPFVAAIVQGHLDDGNELADAEAVVVEYGALLSVEKVGEFVAEIGAARNDEDEIDEVETFLVSLSESVTNQKLIVALDALKKKNCFDRRTFGGLVTALSDKLGEQTIRRLSK